MNVIKTDHWRNNKITMDIDGIILISPQEDVDHDLNDLKDFLKFIIEFTDNQTHYAITDLRTYHFKVTKEAAKYAFTAQEMIKNIGGNAFLIASLPNRLTINFTANFYSPPYPFRAFGNYPSAHRWLLKLKKNEVAPLPK